MITTAQPSASHAREGCTHPRLPELMAQLLGKGAAAPPWGSGSGPRIPLALSQRTKEVKVKPGRVWSQVEPSDWDASDCGGQRPKRSDPQLDNPASAGRAWGAWRPITTTMKKPRSAGQARLFGCQTNRLSVSWCSRRRQRCSPGERQSPCCRGTRRRQHHRNRRARSRWRIPPNLPW